MSEAAGEVMATLEQIIDEARALSPAEKGKLRQALDRELEQPAPPQSSQPSYRTFERENAWLEAHRDEYLGQWVAVEGDSLVAHGTNPREVYLAARVWDRSALPCSGRKPGRTVYWGLAVTRLRRLDVRKVSDLPIATELIFGATPHIQQIVNYIQFESSACGIGWGGIDYRWSSARIWQRCPMDDEPLMVDIDRIEWRRGV